MLNIAERQMELTPASSPAGLPALQVGLHLHLFVWGEHCLQ